jgi:hypothetical protein
MKYNIVVFAILLTVAIGANAKGGGGGGGHGGGGGGHVSSGHSSSGHASTAKAAPASKGAAVSEPTRVAPVVSSGGSRGPDADCKKEKKC